MLVHHAILGVLYFNLKAPCYRSASSVQSAVVFGAVPGMKTLVMNADAVVELVGVVYHGQDGYLINQDSCFY